MTTGSPHPLPMSDHGIAIGDISAGRLTAIVERLAADQYTGRRVGSPGGRAAGRWLAGRLRDLGATVTTQEFPVPGVAELYATPVLVHDESPLTHRRDFVVHPASAELSTPRGGSLVSADDSTWHDRWVLTLTARSDMTTRADQEGAAGLLVPRGLDAQGWMPKVHTGSPAGPVPVLSVRFDLHARMLSQRGVVSASAPLNRGDVTGVNVQGVLRDCSRDGVSVLLTAHYDGVGDDPNERLPAAADNASGVAVVLEAARLLAPVLPAKGGLAVAFLDAEEVGARGSAHHAAQLPGDTQVINVDGAGRLADAASVEAAGPANSLLAALDQAGRSTGVRLRAGAVASDNRRYAAVGLPAVGIGLGVPGYHTPADTPDQIDPTTMTAATDLLVTAVCDLFEASRREPS